MGGGGVIWSLNYFIFIFIFYLDILYPLVFSSNKGVVLYLEF